MPSTSVNNGAQITIGNASTLRSFQSKTLNKSFETFVFGQIVDPNAKAGALHGTSAIPMSATWPRWWRAMLR